MRPSRRQLQPFIRRWSAGRPSATALLVAISMGAFAAQMVAGFFLSEHGVEKLFLDWLALDGPGIHAGKYWKFFTFPLLHHDPLHLLANMLLLYFAGREVEPIVGPRHFLAIYCGGNLLGGVAHWLAMPEIPLVGVTAGVIALFVAFTTILPELEVTLHLFFVLPLRLRAKYLAIVLVAMSAVCWLTLTAPFVGPAGMVAASALGWIYTKQLGFGNPLAIQRYIFEKRQRAARLDRMSPDQFISAEIDPILEKISKHGMHSLSRTERKILEQGRGKIATKTARK
jgi:membrane associated rhomboid family serine protease